MSAEDFPGEVIKEELWRNIERVTSQLSDYPNNVADKIIAALATAGFAVVKMPIIAYKGPHDTDASMLYTAAAKAESARYPVGGSNVGRAVAQVLRDVADQMPQDHQ